MLNQIANALLGLWLMAAPAVLGYGGPARTNDRIVGPLAVSFAVVAFWGITRSVGRVCLLLGLWLLIAPWLLEYGTVETLDSIGVGGLMILFSALPGNVDRKEYGGGWRSLSGRPDGTKST